MKYFSKLIYFFLTIGSNTERRKSRIDYGNMAKIVFYFIQLIGYIYSEFESKSIVFYENDYLAQIGQYSSIPFMMIVIHYDPFTIIMYYCIFGTMCSIYALVIFQVFFKPFPATNIINRFIKFYFQNFQWYFLTPFHESMIGVLTCGRLAYLQQHSVLDPRGCFSEISPHFLVISFIGQVLVVISGFLSLYCFRNYEFIQEGLMRKFSYFNLLTIILHMMLQMASFWKDEYDHFNIFIHLTFNLIMILIGFDTFINLPFGFCYDTVYFTKCLVCSSFYEILIGIWIFSEKLDDGHIFLSFCIGVPLIFGIIQACYDRYIDKQCQLFLLSKNTDYSEHPLETICQLCHQETMEQCDYFIIIKYFGLHCRKCTDLNCPCKQKLNKFINSSNQINTTYIYLWVQYQFQKMIKGLIIKAGQFQEFEQLTIKFVTFLQRYRENQVLSYKIIQDVVYTFSKLSQNGIPYFFQSLTKQIQYQNKVEMENNNRANIQISNQEFITLHDFNIFYQMEHKITKELIELLERQRKLWMSKQENILEQDVVLKCSEEITLQTQKVRRILQKLQMMRENSKMDSILVLRIKLVASLVCMEDLYITIKFAHAIEQLEKEHGNLKTQQFNNQLLFMNGSALSIVSNVSSQTIGQLSQTLNDQFCNFFGYDQATVQLTKIEQLLPFQIGRIHNGLIEAFLQSGKSNRLYSTSEQFLLNSDNLIEKVNICLSMIFPIQHQQHQLIIVAHLMKQFKYNKKEIDFSKKGYILVDSDFLIFGITRNIYERINYKYYYKSKTEIDLITPEEIYDQLTVQQLIPNLSVILEEYYQLLNLKNEKRILKHDIVCTRENGVFQVPFFSQQNYRTSQSIATKKFTNKQMMNALKGINVSLASLNQRSQKQYPIEFSVVQKVLQHYYKDFLTEFLYFVVEVDFLDDPKLNATPQQSARTPALSDIIRRQQTQAELARPNQSNIMMSNDESNDKIELIADITNTATKITQNEIIEQLEKVIVYINDTFVPKGLKDLSAQFLLQNLLIIGVIIVIANLFLYKKQIQSKCVVQLSSDLDFLDAYSQTIAGSRHVIYYRDFYTLQNDTIVSFNDKNLNISKYDKIYIAWEHIANGSQRLIRMYENYSKQVQSSNIKDITLKFINFDLKTTINQEVQDYATYYQIMQQIFYISYQSFASSPLTYLSGKNDSYSTQIARSSGYYNFFNVSESANTTLQDCGTEILEKNNYFDQIVLYYYMALYISIILNFFAINIYYFRVEKSIKLYVRLFKMCDQEDSINVLHHCDKLIFMVKFDRIFLRLRDFKTILDQPKQILKNVKKKSNKSSALILIKRRKKSGQKQQQKGKYSSYYSVLLFFVISLGIIIFIFGFHLFYNHIRDTIQPISERAIKAQQARLNFIISVNRFDLFLIKSYFTTYSELINTNQITHFITRNIQTDTLILNLLALNLDLINQDISRLKLISFANLILESDQSYFSLSNADQNYLLGNDVCLFTGCDMDKDLLYSKLYNSILAPLFKKGVVEIHNKVLSLLDGAYQLISQDQSKLELLQHLDSVLNDSDYLIYILWGIDVVQFQINQFCNFFLQVSEETILSLTNDNQMFIILFGSILLLVIIIFQLMFISYLYKRYTLSKAIIKFIPLPVLFHRNIPKHLENFRRKYEQ